MKVKVCGIRRWEDAEAAAAAGAWALGFVFHRPSPRYVSPQDAALITERLPAGVLAVGVFVDSPLEELNSVVRRAGLDAAQLHGSESPAYARGVEAETVLKAFRVAADFDPRLVEPYSDFQILLDTWRADKPGGTGASFDWEIARKVGERAPVILAGGLNPENVAEAIRVARPSGLDVSGGVELRAGVKDRAAMRRFFDAVGAAQRGE